MASYGSGPPASRSAMRHSPMNLAVLAWWGEGCRLLRSLRGNQQYGNRVSQSHRHTKRVVKVTLQNQRVLIDGAMHSVRTCTRCLRTPVKVGKAELATA